MQFSKEMAPKCGEICPISGQRKRRRILSRLWLSWFFFRSRLEAILVAISLPLCDFQSLWELRNIYHHHPESKKRKSSEENSGSIHPYGRYGNAVESRKTMSTIAILWPVKAILSFPLSLGFEIAQQFRYATWASTMRCITITNQLQ